MKSLNLAEWAIRHKQIVYFFIIAIITGGLWSYFHLGRSEDPGYGCMAGRFGAADHAAGDGSFGKETAGYQGARLYQIFHP